MCGTVDSRHTSLHRPERCSAAYARQDSHLMTSTAPIFLEYERTESQTLGIICTNCLGMLWSPTRRIRSLPLVQAGQLVAIVRPSQRSSPAPGMYPWAASREPFDGDAIGSSALPCTATGAGPVTPATATCACSPAGPGSWSPRRWVAAVQRRGLRPMWRRRSSDRHPATVTPGPAPRADVRRPHPGQRVRPTAGTVPGAPLPNASRNVSRSAMGQSAEPVLPAGVAGPRTRCDGEEGVVADGLARDGLAGDGSTRRHRRHPHDTHHTTVPRLPGIRPGMP